MSRPKSNETYLSKIQQGLNAAYTKTSVTIENLRQSNSLYYGFAISSAAYRGISDVYNAATKISLTAQKAVIENFVAPAYPMLPSKPVFEALVIPTRASEAYIKKAQEAYDAMVSDALSQWQETCDNMISSYNSSYKAAKTAYDARAVELMDEASNATKSNYGIAKREFMPKMTQRAKDAWQLVLSYVSYVTESVKGKPVKQFMLSLVILTPVFFVASKLIKNENKEREVCLKALMNLFLFAVAAGSVYGLVLFSADMLVNNIDSDRFHKGFATLNHYLLSSTYTAPIMAVLMPYIDYASAGCASAKDYVKSCLDVISQYKAVQFIVSSCKYMIDFISARPYAVAVPAVAAGAIVVAYNSNEMFRNKLNDVHGQVTKTLKSFYDGNKSSAEEASDPTETVSLSNGS